MTDLVVLHEAEVELWEAVAYYEEKAHGLGIDFATEVERSMHAVAEYPELRALREDGTRRYLIHRFPYLIVYAYQDNRVWIIAVAHCKRQPGYWRDRLPGTT